MARGQPARHGERLPVQPPDALHGLLHRRAIAGDRALEGQLDQVGADRGGLELDREQVGLLRDEHRGARMAGAELDQAAEGRVGDPAAVHGVALDQPLPPRVRVDRPELVELAEAAEGAVARAEQVPHHVLHAAGEQVADARRALEDGAHALGDRIGVPVRLPLRGHLLELVEEEHEPLAVRLGHRLRQAQGRIEGLLRLLGRQARRQGDLHALAELLPQLQHRGGLRRRQRRAARLARGAHEAVGGRPVPDHLDRQRLRQLRGVPHAEEVHLRDVVPLGLAAREHRVADAGLARAPGSREPQVKPVLEPAGQLVHVPLAPDHLAGRDRLVGREELRACLSHLRRIGLLR